MRAQLSQDREIFYRKLIEDGEALVLNILGFDLDQELPYKHLIEFSRYLTVPSHESIIDHAIKFCNDSFKLPLCLFFHPKIIAAACI